MQLASPAPIAAVISRLPCHPSPRFSLAVFVGLDGVAGTDRRRIRAVMSSEISPASYRQPHTAISLILRRSTPRVSDNPVSDSASTGYVKFGTGGTLCPHPVVVMRAVIG